MKYDNLIPALVLSFLVLCICSCHDDDPIDLEEVIKSTTWTQKTGGDYGSVKTFYQMTFNENGYCHIIWDPWQGGYPPPEELDTIDARYSIKSNHLIFTEPFGEVVVGINGQTDSLDAYVKDYEMIRFEQNLIYLEHIIEMDSASIYIGPVELYLEPF